MSVFQLAARALSALLLAAALSACGEAQGPEEPANDELDRAAVEEIVRSYILENPEIIEEALIELQLRARDRERNRIAEAVAANAEALFANVDSPSFGPADAKVTVVEFFDYRCSFCHVANEWVIETMAEYGDQVRFVFKEFPVLGEQSEEASRAALAVWIGQPEHYLDFHNALMGTSGPLPGERIDMIASENGVDVDQMRAGMDADTVMERINAVRGLAGDIGLSGTPNFIVGDTVVRGADINRLQEALDRQLAG
ncbi:MAG: DsbA family protein [Pseudomonadota bacterium]